MNGESAQLYLVINATICFVSRNLLSNSVFSDSLNGEQYLAINFLNIILSSSKIKVEGFKLMSLFDFYQFFVR